VRQQDQAEEFVSLLTPGRRERRLADVARRISGSALLLFLCLAALLPLRAAELQDLEAIEQTAEDFVAARSASGTASASALDRRLRLGRCEQPLQAYLRAGARVQQRTIVGVRCTGPHPWKVYVPVNLVITQDVVVLTGNLPRGHQLGAADVKVERRDVSRLPGGYLAVPADVLGQRLKQSLRAGAILSPSSLQAEVLIRRGQSVTLSAGGGGVSIRMLGKALMDGALNQRIRVENTSSGRVVEGLVRSAERVEILVQ
jgi:flagellar basal body P-ring formation protein FlgA